MLRFRAGREIPNIGCVARIGAGGTDCKALLARDVLERFGHFSLFPSLSVRCAPNEPTMQRTCRRRHRFEGRAEERASRPTDAASQHPAPHGEDSLCDPAAFQGVRLQGRVARLTRGVALANIAPNASLPLSLSLLLCFCALRQTSLATLLLPPPRADGQRANSNRPTFNFRGRPPLQVVRHAVHRMLTPQATRHATWFQPPTRSTSCA